MFALAALADYRRTKTKEAEIEARELLDDLVWMRLKGFGGAAWGYNFDWQSRSFFLPRGTPTLVPTAFAARALCEATEVFGRDEYLPFARTICDFILNDLNRSEESSDEVCFSYSPLDRTHVLNASLLAGETLASVGRLTGEESLCGWAARAARYVVRRQRLDGSWGYGSEDYQSWVDNFHTAFLLTSLAHVVRALAESGTTGPRHYPLSLDEDGVGDAVLAGKILPRPLPNGEGQQTDFASQAEVALRHGYEFWRTRFFLTSGWPKYYAGQLYPADVHSAATAIIAFIELQHLDPKALEFANTIARWTIENLMDPSGFFYYQRWRFHTIRIPYMRWSEAWMAYALARLLELTQ